MRNVYLKSVLSASVIEFLVLQPESIKQGNSTPTTSFRLQN